MNGAKQTKLPGTAAVKGPLLQQCPTLTPHQVKRRLLKQLEQRYAPQFEKIRNQEKLEFARSGWTDVGYRIRNAAAFREFTDRHSRIRIELQCAYDEQLSAINTMTDLQPEKHNGH